MATKEIYLAGGCFWGTEHFFKQIAGVTDTETGFANGYTDHPTYEQVYTDTTGYLFKIPPQDAERCTSDALETGYRLIDTAQAYGNEEGIGEAVKKSGIPREEIFLVTKIWITNAVKSTCSRNMPKADICGCGLIASAISRGWRTCAQSSVMSPICVHCAKNAGHYEFSDSVSC